MVRMMFDFCKLARSLNCVFFLTKHGGGGGGGSGGGGGGTPGGSSDGARRRPGANIHGLKPACNTGS